MQEEGYPEGVHTGGVSGSAPHHGHCGRLVVGNNHMRANSFKLRASIKQLHQSLAQHPVKLRKDLQRVRTAQAATG